MCPESLLSHAHGQHSTMPVPQEVPCVSLGCCLAFSLPGPQFHLPQCGLDNAVVVCCLPNLRCDTGPFSGADAHVAFAGAFVGSWRIYLVLSRQPSTGAGITTVGWPAKNLPFFTAA